MATSGSVSSSSYSGRYIKLTWERTSYSVANNTSTIKWTLVGDGTASSSYYKAGNFKVIIDGDTEYSSSTRINLYDGTTVKTGTKTIKHNSDGSRTFTVKIQAGIYTVAVNCTGSKTFTLTSIPRKATISTAPNFDDEDNPKITYSNPAGTAVTTLQACIAYSDGSASYASYRDIGKSSTSYTFNLTDTERTALRKACANSNSLSVRFYIKTVIGGSTYYSYLTKTMSIVNATPTATVTVEDSDSDMVALTGDKNKLIKYYSNAKYTISASAKKNATISSYKATCGSLSATTATGTLTNVESGSFSFVIKDSRGNSVTKSVTKTLINYIKPTITIKNTAKSLDGVIDINLAGNYFNSTFGAVDNTCTLQYRYKQSGGTYSDYTTVTPTFNENTYNCNISISGLDYRNTYIVQAEIVDKINTVTSKELSVSFLPVFDWGENNFNLNVNTILANGKGLQGYDTNGEPKNLAYMSTSNVATIGGGSYPPDKVKLACAEGGNVQLSNSVTTWSLLGLARAMTNSYELECTVTKGSNYSSCDASAYLIGNQLRIWISATRSSAVSTGNMNNETVMTINVKHNGKIASLYNVSFNSGTTGGVTTFQTSCSTVDDNTDKVTITMCASAYAGTQWNSYFAMPCTIATSAYV